MKFPIILYGLDKSKLSRNIVTNTNSFYFYSYQKISAKILSGSGILCGVKSINNQLSIEKGQELTNNFGYTLILENDRSTVVLQITSAGDSRTYQVSLNLDNITNELHGNTHYDDLLVNAYLPTYDEISKAIPDEFNQRDIIKRLLLDFRSILKYKGTKKGIENFFNVIGYADKNLTIYDIFLSPSGEKRISKPNMKTDTKTGDYHVIYENFLNAGLDQDNLPIDNFVIENLDSFKEKLINSIVLANTYFTVEEQMIVFFGLEYSSNIPVYTGLTSFMSKVHEFDVLEYRKDIDVNASYFVDSTKNIDIIVNKKMTGQKLFLTEIKYIRTITKNNEEIYFVDEEIYDDLVNLDNFENFESIFGTILHCAIKAQNLFVEYEIVNLNNPLSILKVDKVWNITDIIKQIAFTKSGKYSLIVKTWDTWNNKEEYHFDFEISVNTAKIDFDIFDSSIVNDDFKQINGINLDVDSNVESINKSENFVLNLSDTPFDLSEYYANITNQKIKSLLTNNSRYYLPTINQNIVLDKFTETLPTKFVDSWLNIISCKYNSNFDLKVRLFDGNTCSDIIVDFADLKLYDVNLDCIYVAIFDIVENGTIIPYYFITTTKTGILLNKSTIDFVLVDKSTNAITSIYEQTDLINNILPVNYDFPLFPVVSELVPSFECYISESEDNVIVEGNSFVLIKSVFPRLIDISNDNADNSFNLKIGDIFLCRLTDKFVVKQKDVVWKVINSFTKQLIYKVSGFALTYCVNEETVYDISCEFTIDGKNYSIYKSSILSSYPK